jgi:FtsP/CotA-like multicopper oxidase with cupredoxin domain
MGQSKGFDFQLQDRGGVGHAALMEARNQILDMAKRDPRLTRVGPNGAAYSGKWLLKNTAKAPYPGGAAPQGATTGKVMQFLVTGGPVGDTSYDPKTGQALRLQMERLINAPLAKTRQLTLNEIILLPSMAVDPVTNQTVAYPGGPVEILVNNTKWDGMQITGIDKTDPNMPMYKAIPIPGFVNDGHGNYLSEIPNEGDTEIWEIVNMTMDSHPIHTHLAQFQLLSRQAYDAKKYFSAYSAAFPTGFDYTLKTDVGPGVFIPAFGPPLPYNTPIGGKIGGNPDVTPYLKGPAQMALPQENGWKDTVMVPPGMVTRFIIRWAPQDIPAALPATDCHLIFDPSAGGGGYVWHCHIVDHEDNEMMRPDMVTPNLPETSRTYRIGIHY